MHALVCENHRLLMPEQTQFFRASSWTPLEFLRLSKTNFRLFLETVEVFVSWIITFFCPKNGSHLGRMQSAKDPLKPNFFDVSSQCFHRSSKSAMCYFKMFLFSDKIAEIAAWFRCSRGPIRADREIKIRVDFSRSSEFKVLSNSLWYFETSFYVVSKTVRLVDNLRAYFLVVVECSCWLKSCITAQRTVNILSNCADQVCVNERQPIRLINRLFCSTTLFMVKNSNSFWAPRKCFLRVLMICILWNVS